MANPQAVPAGVYARQYLQSQGLWSRLEERVVPTLDVRGALAAVASGNVETGIVYRTDAAIEDRVKVVYTVPQDEGPPIVYALGTVDQGSGERPGVRAFYDYLRSEPAGGVFERFGFLFLPASTDGAP
jgi:molybdate transport system substrate-binding protein